MTDPALGAAEVTQVHAASDVLLSRVARAVGLADGEGGRAVRLLSLVFVMSGALVLLKAAQSGIFLLAYGRSMIPWAFAASALTLATFSMISVPLAARLGPSRLASTTLLCSALAVLGVRVLLWLHVPHACFVLYVIVEAIAGLLLIQVWSVVSEATNARSAKRLLPIAGIGAAAAWTLGGLLVPAIVAKLGTPSLLLLSPALLLVCLALVRAVAANDLGDGAERGRRRVELLGEWRAGLDFVRKVGLMRLGVALSVLALLTEQLMDFQLMAAARERYGAPGACASFFGAYYGITSAVSMAILLGLSSRLLSRLGASRALLVTPLVTVAAAAVATVTPGFAVIVALRASDRVLKQSTWSSAMEQTQTPLPVVRRAQARALTRGVLAPLAYAVSAIALAFVPEHVDLRWLAFVTGAMCCVMAFIIARGVRPSYEAALRHALDDRRLDLDAESRTSLDADALRALAAELLSSDEGRATLAAQMLATTRAPTAIGALRAALMHPSAAVRTVAIEALGEQGAAGAADAIADRLRAEPDVLVKHAAARALRSLAAVGSASARVVAALRARKDDEDARVAAAVRVALAFAEDHASASRGTALLPLLGQGDALAEEVLTALPPAAAHDAEVHAALRACLDVDRPLPIRRAAMRAIARLRVTPLLADVVALLDDPRLSSEAAVELAGWGDDAEARVVSSLANPESAHQVASSIPLLPAGSGQRLFVRLLSHTDAGVRERASRALAYVVGRGDRAPLARAFVEPLLDREVSFAYRLYGILDGLAHDDGVSDWEIDRSFAFLAGEVERKIAGVRQRVLRLLSLMGNQRVVRAVEFGMKRSSPAVDAKVAELLELSLDGKLARKIVPLFDRLTLRDRTAAAKRLGVYVEEAARDPLAAILAEGDPHLEGAALMTYGSRFRERFPERYDAGASMIPLFERMTFLRSVPLFGELSGEDLRSVAEKVEEVEYEADEVIFKKGDPGHDLFLVVRGQVAVRDGKVELALLGEREFFGELSVLDREPRSADIVATTASKLLRLRASDLAELMARRPQIQEEILLVVVRRLRRITTRVLS